MPGPTIRALIGFTLGALLIILPTSQAQAGDCVPSLVMVDASPKERVARRHKKTPTMMGHLTRAVEMRTALFRGLRDAFKPNCSQKDAMQWYRCASPTMSQRSQKQLSKLLRGSRLSSKQLASLRSELKVTTAVVFSMAIRFLDQRELTVQIASINLWTGERQAQLSFEVRYLEEGYDKDIWPGIAKAISVATRDGGSCDMDDLRSGRLGSAPDWLR